jgi:hypothetical protein
MDKKDSRGIWGKMSNILFCCKSLRELSDVSRGEAPCIDFKGA